MYGMRESKQKYKIDPIIMMIKRYTIPKYFGMHRFKSLILLANDKNIKSYHSPWVGLTLTMVGESLESKEVEIFSV